MTRWLTDGRWPALVEPEARRIGARRGTLSGLDPLERVEDGAYDLRGRRGRKVEADGRRLGQHRVVCADVACHGPEIRPDQHNRLLAEGISDFPGRPRVGVEAVHDRHES